MSYTEEQIEELKKVVFDFNKRIDELCRVALDIRKEEA